MHRALTCLLKTSLGLALCAGMGVLSAFSSVSAETAVAPVITVPGPQSVNEGTLLSFTVSATDADGQPLVLRASGVPSGATFRDFHDNTGSFTWTPSYTQAGAYGVTFIADDTFGGADAKGVPITVSNVNQAPVLDPIGDRQVERGSSMNIFVTGFDPDGDAVSFTQSGLPAWGSFTDYGDGSASLGLAPPANMAPGTVSMTVHLSDGNLTSSETFSITVYSLDSTEPPVLNPIGDQTVAEGSTVNVNVSASDPDGDALSWSVALPGFASFTPTGGGAGSATGTVALAPGYCASGTYSADLAVSDGTFSDHETFIITVSNVNRAPAWIPPSGYSLTLNEGGSANLTVHASDADQACGTAAPALLYLGAVPSTPLAVTFTDQGSGNGLVAVSAGFTAAGTYTLTLRARDAQDPALATDVTVAVTVNGVDRAPVADAGGPYSGFVGTRIALSATGSSDPDGDALTYGWAFGDGDTDTGVQTTHAYGAAGHFVVLLTVNDGTLSATDSTGADVSFNYQARAFMDHPPLRLKTGKPFETFMLEPVSQSFTLGMVVLSSIKLSSPQGMGTAPYITPVVDRFVLGGDNDHNGVGEISMDFAKEDLRLLFTSLDVETPLAMTLTANLEGGGTVRATIAATVQPERKLVARMMPNPLNPETTIRVNMETPDRLSIRLYDIRGRLVRTVMEGVDMPAGVHDIKFDGRGSSGASLPSGRYFYRAETVSERTTGSITIMK